MMFAVTQTIAEKRMFFIKKTATNIVAVEYYK